MNIDKEAELISKYKHLFDPEFVEWKNGLGFMGVADGWTHIVEGLLEAIERHRAHIEKYLGKPDYKYKELMQVKISCIKEKFSSLRVYYTVNDEHREWTDGLVAMATTMADRTCEHCGTTDASVIGMTSGWLTVICKPCHEKKSVALGEDWAKRNPWFTKEDARKQFRIFNL